jgi:hypothetical protein
MSHREEDEEPVDVKHVRCLREAGPKTVVVVPCDPATGANLSALHEVMIPRSQVDPSSEVKKPGDKGTLTIPRWLARDRKLIGEGE